MEVWLLGAGAIVLIGITLWIVWPAHAAEAVGSPLEGKEVLEKSMADTNKDVPVLPLPENEKSDDQYTSATADLSAGGVAAAFESMQDEAAETPPALTSEISASSRPAWSAPADSTSQPWSTPAQFDAASPVPSRLGLGAGVLLALGGAVGGAWVYARWQHERNKPINRLRRGAREMSSRLGERMPDVDELPQAAAPMSGAAAALLLTTVLASRILNRGGDKRADQVSDAVEEALDRGRKGAKRGRQAADLVGAAVEAGGHGLGRRGRKAAERAAREAPSRAKEAARRGRAEARRFAERMPSDEIASFAEDRKPARLGARLGGLGVVGAALFLVWRLARRPSEPKPWYATN
jgi:hypothetical protein